MDTRIKNYVGYAIIVGIALISIAGLMFAHAVKKAAPVTRTFSVQGEGKAVVVPDVGQFTFGVRTEGGLDLAELQRTNTTAANKVIEFVKSKGVDEKDIRTVSYNVEPRQNYFPCTGREICRPPAIAGYLVMQTVEVKVRSFDAIGELLSGVVQQGANEVSQLQFTVDDPSKVKNEARAEAMEKAREAAKATANAGGFRLGRLVSISEGNDYSPPIPYAGSSNLQDSRSVAAPEVRIEPGSQDVKMLVLLTYEIR